ncbi:MAG: fibronectin type III domain-containing protein [Methanomassiliicoccales archaeon]|nr:fibronectin type III domain-containing protein [Methanomassiliicoccales archaeon]
MILIISGMTLTGLSFLSNDASAAPVWAPLPPNDLTAVGDYGKITLNWQAPSGNITAKSYAVYRFDYNYYYAAWSFIVKTSNTYFVDTGVSNGREYGYRVTALSGNNTASDASTVARAEAGSVPLAPFNLVGQGYDERAYLSWSAPDNGGFSIYRYNIYRANNTNSYTLVGSTAGNSYNDYNLINGHKYNYQVAAVNELGTSSRSASVMVTPMTTPSVPGGLMVFYSNASAYLMWNAPLDDGGSRVIEYTIQCRVQNRVWNIDTGSAVTEFWVENLVNGYGYEFTVAAVNAAGRGDYSLPVRCEVLTVPTPVANLNAYADEESAVLTWNLPAYDGGSPVTHYAVYRSTSANGGYSLIGVTNVTLYVDLGLEGGTKYYYRVASGNAMGLGEMSEQVSTEPSDPPVPWVAIVIIASVMAAMVVGVVLQWRKKA